MTVFRSSYQTTLCCVFLRGYVVSDKEKRKDNNRRCEYIELNASEPMLKFRKSNRRCQNQASTPASETECTGYLITGYAASGIKLARQVFRL